MELSDIRVFVTVAEEGSATVAGRVLGMTQPGVSQHLARFEDEMGGKLFNRKGQRLVINEFGKCMLDKVKKLMAGIDELKYACRNADYPRGFLKLGLTDAATLELTPSVLMKFHRLFPKIQIELDVDASSRVEEKVVSGEYDIGFVTTKLEPHPLLEEHVLYEDFIDVLCPPNHELSDKNSIHLKELSKHTLIMSPKRRRTRKIIDAVFALHNVGQKDVIDVYSQTAAVQLAKAGLGLALLPRKFIKAWSPKGSCIQLRISDIPIKRTLSLIHKKGAELSEAAIFFRDGIMEGLKGIG